MKTYGLAYLATGVAFLCLDAVWLTMMNSRLYKPLLGDMLAENFNVKAAALFYFIYIAGIVYFAIQPAFQTGSWVTALVNGALFGFFAYATYDLTNQATLKDWPVTVTAVDLSWGTFVTAVSATLGFLAANAWARAG